MTCFNVQRAAMCGPLFMNSCQYPAKTDRIRQRQTARKSTRMTSRDRLGQAFAAHGITDSVRLESHVRGCDLSRPVEDLTLDPGMEFEVWVRDTGQPGKYGAPRGENPLQLGIMIEGRHREVFNVQQPFDVVICIAATFPTGLVNQVGGEVGGQQYILPPDWLKKVGRVS